MKECPSCKAVVAQEGASYCPRCGASLAGPPPEAMVSPSRGNAARGVTVGENVDQSTKIDTKVEGGIHVSVSLGAARPGAGRPREFALLPLLISFGLIFIVVPLVLFDSITYESAVASLAFGSGVALACVLVSLFAARPRNLGQASYLAFSIAVLLLVAFINVNSELQNYLIMASITAFGFSVVAVAFGFLPAAEEKKEPAARTSAGEDRKE